MPVAGSMLEFCSGFHCSLMKMGYQMAHINNIIATKEAINTKLLGVFCSAVYFFGQWIFH
eukprot:SAG25_NODE_1021_length_4261_cov_5.098624_3_plen_60_part_00